MKATAPMWDRFKQLMSRPVSGASLGFFRMAFGAVMIYEGLYYLGFTWNNPSPTNYIESFYTGEHIAWNIPYPGFSWIKPLPEPLMTALFVAFTVAALLVTVGVLYRLAIVGVFLVFTYINLMDAWTYLNHHYLACIVAMLLIFMAADRRFALGRILQHASGKVRKSEVPFWNVFLLRGQMFIVYFYAGIAKLNPDWLAGEPIRSWLHQPRTLYKLEPWLSPSIMQSLRSLLAHEFSVWTVVYGGLLFDLAIGFLLVFRRTRLLGFLLILGFHTFNNAQFSIGAFPIMALCLSTIFFEPDWPDRLWKWVQSPSLAKPDWRWLIGGVILLPPIGAALGWKSTPKPDAENRRMRLAPWTAALIVGWLVFQCVIPLRHFFITGDSNWTEEGSMFSWHMMLRTKQPGLCQIEIVDPALPMVETEAGRIADWRLPNDKDPLIPYRQVASGAVPWEELPEFLITEEPVLGQRVIYNPLSSAAPRSDTEDYIRRHWQRVYRRDPTKISKTYSVAQLLDIYEEYVSQAIQERNRAHAAAQLQGIAFARQLDINRRDPKYSELERLEFARKLQEALEALKKNPSFGGQFYKMFYAAAAPFDGFGDGTRNTPFYVVLDSELLERGRGTLPAVKRDAWQGDPSTLIDLWTYGPSDFNTLPRCLSFHDLDGRPAVVWNYRNDLHLFQSTFVTLMPPFLHRYVQRLADQWEDDYGRRPEIYVKNYVKLNHHPMQLIVDPKVDLAATELAVFSHNPWILPLESEGKPDPGEVAPGALSNPGL